MDASTDSDGDVEKKADEEFSNSSVEVDLDSDDIFYDGVVEEDDEFDDDEGTSWKVRRTAAKVIDTFIQAFPEKMVGFYTDLLHLIITRLSGMS